MIYVSCPIARIMTVAPSTTIIMRVIIGLVRMMISTPITGVVPRVITTPS
jgi:hypothetical protein